MATTPNYGWVTPSPTNFVTNLPADFETFADAVDADLSGLLGGTTGQILTKDSNADHDFSWVTAGAGKLIQTVVGTLTTNHTNTTATFTDTGLSVTITPTSASNRILVFAYHPRVTTQNVGSAKDRVSSNIRLLRDATQLANGNFYTSYTSETDPYMSNTRTLIQLDDPATTSAVTYKTQSQCSGATTMTVSGAADQINYIIAMEIQL